MAFAFWRPGQRQGTSHTYNRTLLAACLVLLLGCRSVLADDTEVFVNSALAKGVRPNVLLIIDTSGSMNSAVTGVREPYDPSTAYSGECQAGSLYWQQGPGDPPTCDSQARVPTSTNACSAVTAAIASSGLWTGTLAQWNATQAQWSSVTTALGTAPLECAVDAGVDGPNADSQLRWARNGDPSNPWTSDSSQQIDWSSQSVYTLYSGNWLNWYYYADTSGQMSRLDVVKSAASTLINSLSDVNVGLMRYSNNGGSPDKDLAAQGGMVMMPLVDIDQSTQRNQLLSTIDSLSADGYTPLSETLYEAGQYLAGRNVDFGIDSHIDPDTPYPSVPASRDPQNPAQYRSPIQYQCQRNYVVLLTDGEPTDDNSADARIAALPNFSSLVGHCTGSGPGRCLTAMASYLHQADLSSLAGKQTATTYTIGFGPEVEGSVLLQQTAQAGGGQAYTATDVNTLANAFQQILSNILQGGSTFTTPSVSINGFNRTQSSNDLYLSVFQPADTLHWPGNLKKYSFQAGQVVDATGQGAIDPATGYFVPGSQSVWSLSPDGAQVGAGGAVSRLPDPSQRHIYTQIDAGSNVDLTAPDNNFDVTNTAISDTVLGTGTDPTRAQIIQWARGVDVKDQNANGSTTDTFRFMGDPLHARPALVTYGGTPSSPDANDSVVFTATNDGFLHAVNAVTGAELWAFIPQELLSRLVNLYQNAAVASRSYGLDGDITVLRFDANQDGVIDPSAGDKVWIYFGMRRGGRYCYALDVTDRSHPRLMWKLGPHELPGVGETWSAPVITRVKISGATQNGENLVLIMGGGYDGAEENVNFTADSTGNRIFMMDAASGAVLWYAGATSAGSGAGTGTGSPDLVLSNMTNAIAARLTVIDTDGDQYADRIYAADLGGRVWRFDIFNGKGRASLVTGGVFANLGAAGESTPTLADTRRFYYAPDVALIERRGADPYYNIAVGSGYRGHPLNTDTHDRFYSIRDKNPFGKLPQSTYDSLTPLTESDLVDITPDIVSTPVPTTANGWKLELRLNGGWVGEKVLAEALTVNGVILFPTYQPVPPAQLDPCVPANGRNRAYALQVDSGKPAVDFNRDTRITASDAFTQLAQGGIAGQVNLLFDTTSARPAVNTGAAQQGTTSGGTSSSLGRDALGRRALCMVGVEVLQQCVSPGSVVRTFWQRSTTK